MGRHDVADLSRSKGRPSALSTRLAKEAGVTFLSFVPVIEDG